MESSSAKTQAAADLQERLSGIERLLSSDPVLADARAAELLAAAPGNPMALLFQGIARRLLGNAASAIDILRPLCRSFPDAPMPHLQLGLSLRETGRNESAVESMRRAVAIKPDFSDAWLALAELLTEQEDADAAARAFEAYIRYAPRDPRFIEISAALRENRITDAETPLRNHLQRHPNDVAALCMLADVAVRQARFDSAETLLRRCLSLAPGYRLARHNYAVVLLRQIRPAEALQEVDRLLKEERTLPLRNLRAAVLVQLGRYEDAIELYEDLLREQPEEPGLWASLGHALRTVGRGHQCIEAYRNAIALAPNFGEAYWNLANLKTLQIGDPELQAMRAQLDNPDLGVEDRIHFHFAVGKAAEDRGSFAEAFGHFAKGNRLRRQRVHYNADVFSEHVKQCKAVFTSAFFAERANYGATSSEPIFVVGLPRAGSTLVEQILASHSLVEGTMELPHITGIVKSLVERMAAPDGATFADKLGDVEEHESREIGENYIERTRVQRRRGTPFFTDKMPNNFAHIGLIHLILPNARIIDVRRHPLACGMSLFKHLFAQGQTFSYSLTDIGRYYRDYAELMAHFDSVLPGRVHRIDYESLIDDTETEVRRLLEHCGLPFETSCLHFYENKRAVSTASSEQVRKPIFREALDHWRHYEAWLDPLKAELGPALPL